jgi:hypothetical protein
MHNPANAAMKAIFDLLMMVILLIAMICATSPITASKVRRTNVKFCEVGKLQNSEDSGRSHWSWMTSLVIQLQQLCLLRSFAETGLRRGPRAGVLKTSFRRGMNIALA